MTARHESNLRVGAIVLAGLAGVTVSLGLGGALQAGPVIAFLLAGPGLAIAAYLPIDDLMGRLATAVGLSLALLMLVAESLAYLSVAEAGWVLAVLVSATLLLAVPPLVTDRR